MRVTDFCWRNSYKSFKALAHVDSSRVAIVFVVEHVDKVNAALSRLAALHVAEFSSLRNTFQVARITAFNDANGRPKLEGDK